VADLSKILNLLNNNIKSLFSGFCGVYLYGSQVNGKVSENSDIDVVAVFDFKLTREERMKLWEVVGNIEAEYDVIFDLHPMNNDELKQNLIYYNQVVNKGVFYGV